MKSEILRYFPHVQMTGIPLLLFFGSFILVTLNTLRRSLTPIYSHLERLPLDEGHSQ